ncbi:MAG: hypothetical protein ABMA64_36360 [Myxococcota bacterium]
MLLIAVAADAAQVVWVSAPSASDRAAVAAAGGGSDLSPLDLRAAATRWTDADAAVLDQLDAAVRAARPYEAQLDGERVIAADLARPLAAVGALRDDADRLRLYAALAYQGFAVERAFAEELATDPDAAAWRVAHDGVVAPAPWVDASALEPDRGVTAYEIGEAPQRVAFGATQRAVAGWADARLVPEALPAGAHLVVDGRAATLDPTGAVAVRPGRHLAHAALDSGLILARWDVRVAPGDRVALRPALDDPTWDGWVAGLGPGSPVPSPISAAVEALGGEVWVARGTGKELALFAVRRAGVEALPIGAPAEELRGSTGRGPSLTLGAGGGWWFDDGFWLQSPFHTPRTVATVNAGAAVVSAAARAPVGWATVAAGVDVSVPLGRDHAVTVGATAVRPRPHPWVGLGAGPVVVTAGWVFPWHPAVGARAAIPLGGALELGPSVVIGVPRTVARAGAPYATGDLVTAGVTLGARLARK